MTSATTPKTIDLGGCAYPTQREAAAGQIIKPGFLVKLAADGDVDFVAAGEECAAAFAVENDYTGRGIDDDYAVADQAVYRVFQNGDRVYALIQDGQDISFGERLTSNGNGKLKTAGDTDFVVAEAREAVAPSGADGRCIVEIAVGRGTA